jgi:hypothetical protein
MPALFKAEFFPQDLIGKIISKPFLLECDIIILKPDIAVVIDPFVDATIRHRLVC